MNRRSKPRNVLLSFVLLCCLLAGCVAPAPSGGSSAESSASQEPLNVIPVATVIPPVVGSPGVDEKALMYCPLAADGSGYTSRGGASTLVGPLHGPYVLSTVEHTLQEMGGMAMAAGETSAAVGPPVAILVIDEFSAPVTPGETLGLEAAQPQKPIGVQRWRLPLPDGGEGEIVVAEVDIQDFNIALVNEAMASAIAGLSRDYGSRNFVLNMSWVVLPCGAIPNDVDEYVDALCARVPEADLQNLTSIKDEIDALVALDSSYSLCSQPVPESLREAIQQADDLRHIWLGETYANLSAEEVSADGTFFYELFNCLGPTAAITDYCQFLVDAQVLAEENFAPPGELLEQRQQFIPIAASGNTSPTLPIFYPFEPALWDGVISVSATDAAAYHANSGEIALSGKHPSALNASGLPHEGTSFAAPRLSAWAAVYLLSGGQSPCPAPPADAETHVPVLGYKGEGRKNEPYDNLLLQDAAVKYCEKFETMLDAWELFHPGIVP